MPNKKLEAFLQIRGVKKASTELAELEIQLVALSKVLRQDASKDSAKKFSALRKEQVLLQEQSKKLRNEIRQAARDLVEFGRSVPKSSIEGMRRQIVQLTKDYGILSKAERRAAKGQALQKKLIILLKKYYSSFSYLYDNIITCF